jgi:hypothetical protein
MISPGSSNIFERARHLAGQDPRKVLILATLLVLLGFLIVRQAWNATASAEASRHVTAPASSSVDSDEPDSSSRTGKLGVAGAGESPVQKWLQSPPTPLTRNLFALKLDVFPSDVTRSHESEESRGFWEEVAKSLLDQADQQERKQELLSSLQEQAKALRLTSVLMGPKPRAVINGELVGEGDVVAGFRVLQIEPRRIVIEREGIRLEITMN